MALREPLERCVIRSLPVGPARGSQTGISDPCIFGATLVMRCISE